MSSNKDQRRSRSRGPGGKADAKPSAPAKSSKTDLRRVVTIAAHLSNDKLELLRKEWPQYNIRNGELVNEHAYLNADRELASIFSRSRAIGRVKHIGGRLQLLSPGDHSCNPIIKPSDVFRRNAPKGVVEWGPESNVQPNGKTFCACRAENCSCRFIPKSYVSVHSLYDFNTHQIAALIGSADRRLYSYVHRFPNEKGLTPFEEAAWEIHQKNGEDWVTFTVRGASAPYLHPAMTWLWNSEDTLVTMPDGREMTLVWRVLLSNKLGGLIEFAITDLAVPAPIEERFGGVVSRMERICAGALPAEERYKQKAELLKESNDYLESAISVFKSHDSDAATYARVDCTDAKVSAEMLGIRVAHRAVNLLLPIELLRYASQRCAGMQRTSTSFGLLVTYVRERAKELKLGNGDPGQVIFGTAAVAFTKNVRFESELMKLLYLPYTESSSSVVGSLLPGCMVPSWFKRFIGGWKTTFTDHARIRNFDFDVGDHVQNWWSRREFHFSEGWKVAGLALALSACHTVGGSLMRCKAQLLPGAGVDKQLVELLALYKHHPSGRWLEDAARCVVDYGQVAGKYAVKRMQDPEVRILCGVAPIVEECLKRVKVHKGFNLKWLLYAYEALVVNRGDPRYFATFLMHEAAFHLPLPLGIAAHVCWNLFALSTATPLGAAGIVGTNGLLVAGALLEGIGHLSVTHQATNEPPVVCGQVTVATSCHVASTGRDLDLTNPAEVLKETFNKPMYWFNGRSTVKPTCRWHVPDKVCGPTFGCRLAGVGLVTHAPCILRSCKCNEVVGIRQRMWAPVPWRGQNFWCVGKLVIDHCLTLSMYRDACPLACGGKIRPYGFEEWVKRFPSGTRSELVKAKQDLDNGLIPPRVFDYKAFLKRERLPLSYLGKELSTPRIIQGLGFHARVITGPWFAAYSDRVKEAMRISPERLLCTGMGATSESVGGWLRNALDVVRDPVILAVDQSKWDAHLHPEFLAARVPLYEALGAPKPLLEFCKRRITAVGRTMNGVSYGTVGTVHSGDGDTSAGNNVDHGMMWLRLLARGADAIDHDERRRRGDDYVGAPLKKDELYQIEMKVETGLATTGEQGRYESYRNSAVMRNGQQFRILVMGDDGVIVLSRALLVELGGQDGIRNYFRQLGFTLTSSETTVENLEFCSGLFYPVNGTYIYGPKPGRVLAKTFWTQVDLNPAKTKQWLRGVVKGLMSDCTHIPLMGPWLHHLLPHNTESCEFQQEERRIRSATQVPPDRSTIEFTMARYGISEDDITQAVAEAKAAALRSPSRLNTTLWHRIAAVDNA